MNKIHIGIGRFYRLKRPRSIFSELFCLTNDCRSEPEQAMNIHDPEPRHPQLNLFYKGQIKGICLRKWRFWRVHWVHNGVKRKSLRRGPSETLAWLNHWFQNPYLLIFQKAPQKH